MLGSTIAVAPAVADERVDVACLLTADNDSFGGICSVGAVVLTGKHTNIK